MNRIFLDGAEFKKVNGLENYQVTYTRDRSSRTSELSITNEFTFTGSAYDYLFGLWFSDSGNQSARVSVTIAPAERCCDVEDEFFMRGTDVLSWRPDVCELVVAAKSESEPLRKLRSKLCWKGLDQPPYVHPNVVVGYLNTATTGQGDFGIGQGTIFTLNIILPLHFPSPYIVTYLRNIANLCGLTLQSSIFESAPYNRAVFFNAPNEAGLRTPGLWIPENAPNLTCEEFLNLLKPIFNIDYQIANGVLIVERKDYFEGPGPEDLVNPTTDFAFSDDRRFPPEYKFRERVLPAEAIYEYQLDPSDELTANLANFYNLEIDYNPNDTDSREEINRVTVPLGIPLFFEFGFDEFPYLKRPESGVFHKPKIIVLEKESYALDERPRPESRINDLGTRDYNYSMYFDDQYPAEELYQRFHFIDAPDETQGNVVLSEYTFPWTCDTISLARTLTLNVSIATPYGAGRPEELVLDYGNKTITVRDVKLL